MEITAAKIDDYKIRITKTEDPVITEHEYDINFLLKQKKDIQKQKDDFCALRDVELKEVEELLVHCETHGLISKPVDDVKPIEDITPIEEIKPIEDIKPIVITPLPIKKNGVFSKIKGFLKWQ